MRPRYHARVLTLHAVSKSFDGPQQRNVLSGIDLSLSRGEYIAVMGESGVGKSTLLNLIAGLDRPDSGRVLFDGEVLSVLGDDDLTRLRRRCMGFVFQAFHVLPYLSVAQNVELPLALLHEPADAARSRTREMLDAVGLGSRASSMPRELSGGELQRVGIARALVHRPQLLLADEPTGNLDSKTARQVLGLLREQIKAGNAAGILVTHSRDAAASADRSYLLSAHGLELQS